MGWPAIDVAAIGEPVDCALMVAGRPRDLCRNRSGLGPTIVDCHSGSVGLPQERCTGGRHAEEAITHVPALPSGPGVEHAQSGCEGAGPLRQAAGTPEGVPDIGESHADDPAGARDEVNARCRSV